MVLNIYVKFVTLLLFFVASVGWIMPALFSATSDEAILGGVVYFIVVFLPITYLLGNSIFKILRKVIK